MVKLLFNMKVDSSIIYTTSLGIKIDAVSHAIAEPICIFL